MHTLLGKKPYAFVPIASQCQRQPVAGHNDLLPDRYSGKLILSLEVKAPLHISQGLLGIDKAGLYKKTMRRHERVVIPGSSVKGVVRSIAEAVSHSCAPQLPDPRLARLRKALPQQNQEPCKSAGSLCHTCAMFGMSQHNENYRGQIRFGEFVLEQAGVMDGLEMVTIPELSAPFKDYPRNHPSFYNDRSRRYDQNYGNERLYYCRLCPTDEECRDCSKEKYLALHEKAEANRPFAFRGRKFYYPKSTQEGRDSDHSEMYEVIQPGRKLVGSVTYENLTKEQLALFGYSLGVNNRFNLRMGYGKPAYFGQVKVTLLEVKDALTRYGELDRESMTVEVLTALASAYGEGEVAKDSDKEERKKQIDAFEKIMNTQGPAWQNLNGNKIY